MLKKIFSLDNIMCFVIAFFLAYNTFYTHGKDEYMLQLLPLLIIVFFGITRIILNFLGTKSLNNPNKFNKKEYIVYVLILVLAMTLSIKWNDPAALTIDSDNCFNQAITNTYSDWHPVFYTLIFFKLPSLFYEGFISCSIFQCIFISLILLYFCKFCRKYFLSMKHTVILLLFIVSNPVFLKYASGLIKDIPFSYCIFLGTIFLIENFITNGEWMLSTKNKILFILMCFGTVFFRHNGIVNMILMTIFLIIFYPKSRKFLSIFLVSFLIIRAIITGPVYTSFDIKGNGGFGEMLGVPLNQIAYIYNNNGTVTDENLEIMKNIAKLSSWKNHFHPTSFNNIKMGGSYNYNYCNEHYIDILNTWFDMVCRNPGLALESYIHVTSTIWQLNAPNGEISSICYSFGLPRDTTLLDKIMNNYIRINSDSLLRIFFIDIGEGFLLLLISLILLIKKVKLNIKAYIPYILVAANILIVMILITGREARLLYSSILCAYPLLLYSFKDFKIHNTEEQKMLNEKKSN